MKKIVCLTAIIILSFILTGCSRSGSIVGTWTSGGTRYEFNDNGTYSINWPSAFGTSRASGTYETNGNRLNFYTSGLGTGMISGYLHRTWRFEISGDTMTLRNGSTMKTLMRSGSGTDAQSTPAPVPTPAPTPPPLG
ncbi:MAG: hypothetical protein FWD90_02495 [Defluviitaleaceae bacterium]|nr:hypothetical protein [Defluviitaleaceae bacterium]